MMPQLTLQLSASKEASWGSDEAPKFKKMRHYNTLAKPQNARNPFPTTSIVKILQGRIQGTAFDGPYLESPSLTEILYPPQLHPYCKSAVPLFNLRCDIVSR